MTRARTTASQVVQGDVIAGAVVERVRAVGGVVYLTVSDMLGERRVMALRPGAMVTIWRP
jgi:hypothetical protein